MIFIRFLSFLMACIGFLSINGAQHQIVTYNQLIQGQNALLGSVFSDNFNVEEASYGAIDQFLNDSVYKEGPNFQRVFVQYQQGSSLCGLYTMASALWYRFILDPANAAVLNQKMKEIYKITHSSDRELLSGITGEVIEQSIKRIIAQGKFYNIQQSADEWFNTEEGQTNFGYDWPIEWDDAGKVIKTETVGRITAPELIAKDLKASRSGTIITCAVHLTEITAGDSFVDATEIPGHFASLTIIQNSNKTKRLYLFADSLWSPHYVESIKNFIDQVEDSLGNRGAVRVLPMNSAMDVQMPRDTDLSVEDRRMAWAEGNIELYPKIEQEIKDLFQRRHAVSEGVAFLTAQVIEPIVQGPYPKHVWYSVVKQKFDDLKKIIHSQLAVTDEEILAVIKKVFEDNGISTVEDAPLFMQPSATKRVDALDGKKKQLIETITTLLKDSSVRASLKQLMINDWVPNYINALTSIDYATLAQTMADTFQGLQGEDKVFAQSVFEEGVRQVQQGAAVVSQDLSRVWAAGDKQQSKKKSSAAQVTLPHEVLAIEGLKQKLRTVLVEKMNEADLFDLSIKKTFAGQFLTDFMKTLQDVNLEKLADAVVATFEETAGGLGNDRVLFESAVQAAIDEVKRSGSAVEEAASVYTNLTTVKPASTAPSTSVYTSGPSTRAQPVSVATQQEKKELALVDPNADSFFVDHLGPILIRNGLPGGGKVNGRSKLLDYINTNGTFNFKGFYKAQGNDYTSSSRPEFEKLVRESINFANAQWEAGTQERETKRKELEAQKAFLKKKAEGEQKRRIIIEEARASKESTLVSKMENAQEVISFYQDADNFVLDQKDVVKYLLGFYNALQIDEKNTTENFNFKELCSFVWQQYYARTKDGLVFTYQELKKILEEKTPSVFSIEGAADEDKITIINGALRSVWNTMESGNININIYNKIGLEQARNKLMQLSGSLQQSRGNIPSSATSSIPLNSSVTMGKSSGWGLGDMFNKARGAAVELYSSVMKPAKVVETDTSNPEALSSQPQKLQSSLSVVWNVEKLKELQTDSSVAPLDTIKILKTKKTLDDFIGKTLNMDRRDLPQLDLNRDELDDLKTFIKIYRPGQQFQDFHNKCLSYADISELLKYFVTTLKGDYSGDVKPLFKFILSENERLSKLPKLETSNSGTQIKQGEGITLAYIQLILNAFLDQTSLDKDLIKDIKVNIGMKADQIDEASNLGSDDYMGWVYDALWRQYRKSTLKDSRYNSTLNPTELYQVLLKKVSSNNRLSEEFKESFASDNPGKNNKQLFLDSIDQYGLMFDCFLDRLKYVVRMRPQVVEKDKKEFIKIFDEEMESQKGSADLRPLQTDQKDSQRTVPQGVKSSVITAESGSKNGVVSKNNSSTSIKWDMNELKNLAGDDSIVSLDTIKILKTKKTLGDFIGKTFKAGGVGLPALQLDVDELTDLKTFIEIYRPSTENQGFYNKCLAQGSLISLLNSFCSILKEFINTDVRPLFKFIFNEYERLKDCPSFDNTLKKENGMTVHYLKKIIDDYIKTLDLDTEVQDLIESQFLIQIEQILLHSDLLADKYLRWVYDALWRQYRNATLKSVHSNMSSPAEFYDKLSLQIQKDTNFSKIFKESFIETNSVINNKTLFEESIDQYGLMLDCFLNLFGYFDPVSPNIVQKDRDEFIRIFDEEIQNAQSVAPSQTILPKDSTTQSSAGSNGATSIVTSVQLEPAKPISNNVITPLQEPSKKTADNKINKDWILWYAAQKMSAAADSDREAFNRFVNEVFADAAIDKTTVVSIFAPLSEKVNTHSSQAGKIAMYTFVNDMFINLL